MEILNAFSSLWSHLHAWAIEITGNDIKDRQTDRQADRQTVGQTDRCTVRHTVKESGRMLVV